IDGTSCQSAQVRVILLQTQELHSSECAQRHFDDLVDPGEIAVSSREEVQSWEKIFVEEIGHELRQQIKYLGLRQLRGNDVAIVVYVSPALVEDQRGRLTDACERIKKRGGERVPGPEIAAAVTREVEKLEGHRVVADFVDIQGEFLPAAPIR